MLEEYLPNYPRMQIVILNTPAIRADDFPQNALYRDWNSINYCNATSNDNLLLLLVVTLLLSDVYAKVIEYILGKPVPKTGTFIHNLNYSIMAKDANVAAAATIKNAEKTNLRLKGQLVKNPDDKYAPRVISFIVDWTDVRYNNEFGTPYDVKQSSFTLSFNRFKAIAAKKFDINGALNAAKNVDKKIKELLDEIGFDIKFVRLEENETYVARDGYVYEPKRYVRVIQDIEAKVNPAIVAKYPVAETTIEIGDDWV